MDIYITEIETGRKIRIPALPEAISCGADGRFATYEIMRKGEVLVPEGRNLEQVAWEATFPGAGRKNEPWVREWTDPLAMDATFKEWRIKQPVLKVVITDTNINFDCYLEKYLPNYSGGYGDIGYSLSFREKDAIVVRTIRKSTNGQVKPPKTTTRTTPAKPKTYTIKSGDCLWKIAQKHYGKGAEWVKLYNANKDIIEREAKRHGKKSSDRGHWIYPGTVISIP